MTLWDLSSWVLFGLLAGIVAGLLKPGRDPGGCVVTSLVGIFGAMLGGEAAIRLELGGVSAWDWRGFVLAVIGAILLLVSEARRPPPAPDRDPSRPPSQ